MKILDEEILSPKNSKIIFDYLQYNKDKLKLSKNTKSINNHLLTKFGNFFCCINNINISKNTDYLVNIDLLQKFRFDRNLLELYIYGLNQYLISKQYLHIPKHISTFKINSGNNNNLSLLLYSKNKVNHSFITINDFTISRNLKNNFKNNFDSENCNYFIEDYTKKLFNFDDDFQENYKELQNLCYCYNKSEKISIELNNPNKKTKNASIQLQDTIKYESNSPQSVYSDSSDDVKSKDSSNSYSQDNKSFNSAAIASPILKVVLREFKKVCLASINGK